MCRRFQNRYEKRYGRGYGIIVKTGPGNNSHAVEERKIK